MGAVAELLAILFPFRSIGTVTRHQRTIIELSVQILRTAMKSGAQLTPDDAAVRLALRCLWPHCPERWPLVQFWDGGRGTHELGRSQSMTASFNGIVHQLRRSGAWTDQAP